jgi:hypothetical protein
MVVRQFARGHRFHYPRCKPNWLPLRRLTERQFDLGSNLVSSKAHTTGQHAFSEDATRLQIPLGEQRQFTP